MEVQLLSYTPDALRLIFAAGRQCYSPDYAADIYNSTGLSIEKAEKLVSYLKESGHTSVLEHATFSFAIKDVSRALTHQLVRHRIASYSQQSQRYVDLSTEVDFSEYIIPPKIASNSNLNVKYKNLMSSVQSLYNELVLNNILPEDARYVLPNAATTKIVLTMNCVALLHFFGLRCCTLAQWEIRQLSNKMLAFCKDILPAVFVDAGSRCISLGYCPENKKRSCGIYPTKQEVLAGFAAWKKQNLQEDLT